MERHELLQTVRERGIVHSPKDSHRHAAFAARGKQDQKEKPAIATRQPAKAAAEH